MLWVASLLALVLLWLIQSQLYRVKISKPLPKGYGALLNNLGKASLSSADVPIAALLVYKGEIIGEGYNTVKADSRLSSHAEINALNMAFKKYGEKFAELDRDKLVLYSTFEPCPMCKGALVNFNIRRVYFEERKPVGEQVKWSVKELYYEFAKRPLQNKNIQQELFKQHPSYRKHHGLD